MPPLAAARRPPGLLPPRPWGQMPATGSGACTATALALRAAALAGSGAPPVFPPVFLPVFPAVFRAAFPAGRPGRPLRHRGRGPGGQSRS